MQARRLGALILFLILGATTVGAQGIIDIRPHPGPDTLPRSRVQPITIVKHHVDISIEGAAATTKVLQVFHNSNAALLEGRYIFPIPDAASITEFTMVMNGKTVKGEVLEKEKARAIYEDIVRRMRDPALLEYLDRNLFQARVFPIPAAGDVEISLTYVEELKSDAGVFEYRYPLKTQGFARMPVESLVVSAVIKSARELKSVFSSSHTVAVNRRSEHEVSVSFEGKRELADRDFNLFFTESGKGLGLHLLSEKNAREGGFFMMKLSPPLDYTEAEITSKDIVFVLDTSGSMQEDEKISQARLAIIHGLRSLRPSDRFNIVTFATDARSYEKSLVIADKESVAQAIAWVKEISAAGGTNIDDALKAAADSLPDAERMRMVVFVTDGRPTIGVTDEKKILGNAAERLPAGARLFVFGVGFDVNARLLDLLADQGRGARDYVTPGQNLELELSAFFDKVANPVLSDIVVKAEGVELFEVYPKTLPDLFKGGEITVLGRYRGEGHHVLRLQGKVGASAKEFIFEGNFAAEKAGRDFIPVLWAKRKVGYLYDEIRLKGENRELIDEIVRLGTTFGIATPYTSFLVLEDDGQWSRDTGRRQAPGGGDLLPPSSPQPIGGGGGGNFRGGVVPGDAAKSGGDQSDREAASTVAELRRRASTVDGRLGVINSIEAKKLKDSDELSEDDRAGTEAARRLKGRSFRLINGVWTQLDGEGKPLDLAKAEAVEAFSERYFALIKQQVDLAEILSACPNCLVSFEGKLYRFKVAPPVPDPAPESQPQR